VHELGVTRGIVAVVAEHARGRPVQRVAVDIGRLSGVMPEAVQFCFDVVAQGTCVEGATLEIRHVEGRGRCRTCGNAFAMPQLYTPCPCGSRDVERTSGEELKVREFQYRALEADAR
jgi:hydrogenase nickel incorporation protein HypA/HybF